MWNQELYVKALKFAATAHGEQRIPGSGLPYVVHLTMVAMEILALPEADDLSVACALLHDCLEDTETPEQQLRNEFGSAVAGGVKALTKDGSLPKKERMRDSLRRLGEQPKQVQMVKLADRITNLQKPPESWSVEKCRAYQQEAIEILKALGDAHPELHSRLEQKIADYSQWCGA